MIGIVAALRQELSLLIRHVRNPVRKKAGGLDMVTGRLNDVEVAITSTGIGKVKAAAATQALIDAFAPGEVWCIGLGGALDAKLKAGDVVIADELYQHDLDLSGGSRVAALLTRGRGASLVKCDKKLVKLARDSWGQTLRRSAATGKGLTPNQCAKVGRIVTGDRAVLKAKDKKELARQTRALCVEMEGAAVGQVCARNRIPFIVIRAISDTADGNSLLQFAKNYKKAARIPQQIILNLLHRRGVYPACPERSRGERSRGEQGRGAEKVYPEGFRGTEENEGRNDG